MESFLLQATIYLGAAVIAVPLAARLGLGSVLGYLAAGLVIGPILGLVGSETEDLRHFAEFGVVMMLFLIGLELEPRALWDMRQRLIGLGGLQLGLTMTAVTAISIALGLPWQTGLALGMVFALSSTAIVLQTLDEKRLMQTPGGRSSFSVLLTQDIAVIPMLALLPLLAVTGGTPPEEASIDHGPADQHSAEHTAEHGMSLVEGLPGWGVTLVTIAAVGAVILAGTYLTRPVFRYIHNARLREMYTALALLMVVATAVLMGLVGLSAALGTFLAGVVLANSEFRHELESDLEPFKGLLLGLFFITVGAGIDFGTMLEAPLLIFGVALGLILLKGAVLYLLARMFGLTGRDRWLFTLSLAQAGEFGFVLVSFALQIDVFTRALGEQLLLIIALTMLATPLLFLLFERIGRDAQTETPQDDEIDEEGPVIIAGIGRFGQVVNRLVTSAGFQTVVLDNDMEIVETMRTFGSRAFFGDPSRPDVLHAAGIAKAKVLVVSLDDRHAALKLTAWARQQRPDLHIVARAYDRVHVYELYQAGANDIVREMFDSSLRAGRYVLEQMGLTDFEASEAEMTFYHHDRSMVRQLAELWKPGVPVSRNPDYVARAKELNSELETALLSGLAGRDGADAPDVLPDPGYRSKPRKPGTT